MTLFCKEEKKGYKIYQNEQKQCSDRKSDVCNGSYKQIPQPNNTG